MAFDYRQPGAGLAAHPFTQAPGFDAKAYATRLMDAGAADNRAAEAYRAQNIAGGLLNPKSGLQQLMGGQAGGLAAITQGAPQGSYMGRFGNQTMQAAYNYLRQKNPSLTWDQMRQLDAKTLMPAIDYAFSDAERRRQQRGTGFVHRIVAPAVMGGLAGGLGVNPASVVARGTTGVVQR